MANNKVVRLTEEDIHSIILNSVNQIIKENAENEGFWNNMKTAAKSFVGDTGRNRTIGQRFNDAKANYTAQGEYDDIDKTVQLLNGLLQKGKINPDMTVGQLVGGKFRNNKFGTLTGKQGNLRNQMLKRGLSK